MIQVLAKANARLPLTKRSNILNYLKIWWSNYYQRPMKDPVLLEYTFEELAYEYYAHSEYESAKKERIEQENVKIEEETAQEAQSWADQMEAEEFNNTPDPTKDPNNVAWMEQQLALAKDIYGENFGDDISEGFE